MAIAIIAAVVAVAAFMLLRHQKAPLNNEPTRWSVGPPGYTSPIAVDADGSFDFPTSTPGVHYVTKACGPIQPDATLTLKYRIDGNASFHPTSNPNAPSIGPALYFQRAGDDWSGTGEYETYRWWATFSAPMPITPGEHTITVSMKDRWTAVETSNSHDQATAFSDALANAARIGFTFGGGTGYGHGVYADGPARLTLLSFN